ncbi:uncharacterized protein BP01DRAFT_378896 [Aspergillus saccharolyticus JOP 1030-1]|uniref:Uncharacterized protein n=1 Tax=Aspergillus saccharolyticus JOP 1030-1 TaxID=1450539 RepID=A0A318ZP05_9EURO|nr:hypothetical protein BP01DRAFT_378896 [Aspergillus saccharolyticus JOP 1030-1]PYH49329.1 hypothetical protein BP01DRAFT_378896 [Aspergillus saccharolyticus JOP 1030-1]
MTQGKKGDNLHVEVSDLGVVSGARHCCHLVWAGPNTGTVQPDLAEPPTPPPLYGEQTASDQPKTSGGYSTRRMWRPTLITIISPSGAVRRAVDQGRIHNALGAYSADLRLLILGFKDMGWFYSEAPGILDSILTLISNACAGNPNLKFTVANVPQRSFVGGREDLPISSNIYNALRRTAIPEWITADSPIYLDSIQFNSSYNNLGRP